MILSIPSPSMRGFYLGPIYIYFYSLCILAGILIATWIGRKRFIAKGGYGDHFDVTVIVTVIFGIVGARIYHVITDYQLYFCDGCHPWQALNIRNGGLGIWGSVALGAVGLWLCCRRYHLHFPTFADVLAPGVIFAQAIGRLGNWFNQELFGRPTSLPWGLHIEQSYRPPGYENFVTFHPTFLYELIWCVIGGIVLLLIERYLRWGRGKIFTSYVVWYTFGRFFIEALRIDPVNHISGFRLNNYVSIGVFTIAFIALCIQLKFVHGDIAHPFSPAPARMADTSCEVIDLQAESTDEGRDMKAALSSHLSGEQKKTNIKGEENS